MKKDCDGAYNILARSLFESDRWAEALESVSAALAFNGDDYAASGREDDAVRELQKAVDLRPNDSSILYNAACTYGVMKRKPEAIEMLRRARAAGYANPDWIRRDPDLSCLHGEPEFEKLLEE